MFTPYDRIPMSSRSWEADPAALRRLSRVDWVVTEKIHGANFCFVISGDGIDCARRKALLGPGEDFFGHNRVLNRLREPLRRLFAAQGAPRLFVYGELFGGGYPHPDVPAVSGVQPVQTGVWYHPDVRFVAFDVVSEEARRGWWGFDEMTTALEAAGVPFVPPRFIGGWSDALTQSVDFTTEVPARLGLPPLGDNLAEGIVLKPREPVLVGERRPTLKRKNPRFAEDARYLQARKWDAPTTAPLDVLEYAMLSRLTPARVAAARSKLGPSASPDEMAHEVSEDVWRELGEEHSGLVAALPREDAALLAATLAEEAATLVG